ncbi:response regulator transcription factor [Gulosibacter sp. 10]|uniref:response regulator transcription factor n=1 Tax=Gulosibacter sp. 10 TaxID=1255570 RepID=UPI00097E7ADB|nr:response regulator transcription factor [Gulosibacter sp. 10]SJM49316.1 DNA-binding response regulator, LuxR family [Gulosibacter sp. 10]
MSAEPIRVLLADDEPLLRRSLGIAIDRAQGLRVVGEAEDGADAVAQTRALRPDVVLMDIRMPRLDGIDATGRIASQPALRGTRVIVLTMFELDEYVYGALAAGASAFLLKDTEPERLIDAIRRVHAGESLFTPQIMRRLVEHFVDRPVAPGAAPRIDGLTAREHEVLALVGRGLSNTEIAEALTVTIHTVKAHIGALRAKLHARDRAQLVIAAYSHRLVEP